MSECGQRASFNGADGISDIEGKVAKVATSERGQISEIEGKVARVTTSERG